MRALVTHGHCRSRDKDSGHTTAYIISGHTVRSAVSENTMLQSNLTALCFTETE